MLKKNKGVCKPHSLRGKERFFILRQDGDEMITKDEMWLRDVLAGVENQMRENNLEGFMAVVKVLVKDASKALEDAKIEWELDHNSQELREKFHVVGHYLDYLRRFVEGIV